MLGADPRSLPYAVLAQQPCIRLVHSRLEDLAYLELLVSYLRMLPTLVSADLPQARVPFSHPLSQPLHHVTMVWQHGMLGES